MPALHIGCLLDRLPGVKLTQRLGFFELVPRPPIPKYGTFARFRKEANPNLEVSLVAPRSTWLSPRGPMRPGPELDQGIAWLLRAADAIGASCITVPTLASLTPGERDRNLTAAFFERLQPSGKTLVFAPGGLWEPEQAVPFTQKIGAVYGFDPLEHDPPPGTIVYARIRPIGVRARLSEGHLMRAAERLLTANCEHIYVSIASEHGPRDALRMLAVLKEAGELVAAGMAAGQLDDDAEEADNGEDGDDIDVDGDHIDVDGEDGDAEGGDGVDEAIPTDEER